MVLAQQLPSIDAIDAIGSGGLAVVLLLFIGGYLWAKPAVETILKASDKKDTENAALRMSIEERIIPVVEHNTQLAERVAVLLEQHIETDRLMMRALEDLANGKDR